MIYQGYVTLTTYNKKGQIVSRSTHHNNGTESFFNLLYNLLVGGVSNIDVKSLPHLVQMYGLSGNSIDYNNSILLEPASIKNRTVKKFGLNTTQNCASFTFLLDSYNVNNNNRDVWDPNADPPKKYALVLYPDDVTAGENQLAYIIPTEKLDLRTGYITSVEWQMIFTNETSLTYNTQSVQTVNLSKGLSLSSSLDQPLDLQDDGNLQIVENNEGEQR